MGKYTVFWKKYWAGVVLCLIVILAFSVRFYQFDEWLYFKMDQSRDALLIGNAIEYGPGYLPLLGARAGATDLEHGFLRLGPAYYYFQYLSGKLFNSTHPSVFAYPDLFFGVAVIPLLYFFLRLYFSRRHSLLISSMYAFSFLIIQYSRFAWNPNSLQFFIILAFYGLLRFLNEPHETLKKWWLVVFVFGLTIGSQLHFFGFFSLLGISGLLIVFHMGIWKRGVIATYCTGAVFRRFAVFVALALGVFLFLYTPVIISDFMEGGQNTKNFFEALGSKAEKKPLLEKVQKDIAENANYYCLLTTSSCSNGDMKSHTVPIAISLLIMVAGIALAIRRLRTENNPLMRDFLMLTLLWFAVFSVLTLPVAFQLRPRFYIVVFALPFIFLGFLYTFLEERFGRRGYIASVFITGIILAMNIYGTALWFGEQAKAQHTLVDTKRTLILKAKDGVTLGQLQRVTDWMYDRHREGAWLYFYVKPEHVRPLQFLLYAKHDKSLQFTTLKITPEPNVQYFAVTPAKNKLEAVEKKFGSDFTVIAQEQFGQLLVSEIYFPNRIISDSYRFNKKNGANDRIFWNDVFHMEGNRDAIEIDDAE